jgi:hypothetical protein
MVDPVECEAALGCRARSEYRTVGVKVLEIIKRALLQAFAERDIILVGRARPDDQHADPQREMNVVRQLADERYDAAIIFTSFRQSSLPGAYLCYLAGIPLRLGASIDASGSLLTTRHKHPDGLMHEVERGLDLVGAVGISSSDRIASMKRPVSRKAFARR